MNLHELVSPLFKNYIYENFGTIDLTESKATCENCLCSTPKRMQLPYYSPILKCCTFHPFLPNFAVGALLSSSTTPQHVKDTLLQKINLKEYALPLGVFPPVKFQVEFNNREEKDFGNKSEFLCPYYDKDKNACGIWLHRGSVCTSYYCISDRGEQGLQIWEKLGEYLHLLEMSLAQDCLVTYGLPYDMVESQFEYINCTSATNEEMKSNSMSQAIFQSYWDGIEMDPVSFYISTYEYAKKLNTTEFQSLLDPAADELKSEILNLF